MMVSRRVRSVIPFVLALSAFALEAQQATPPPAFEAIRLAEPPSLEWFVAASDGPLREPGAAITDFRQRAPGDGTPVSQSTTAFLSYDEDHLYVVFVCKDTPAAIRANISRREDIGDDDAVAIYLDTFRDRQRAYVFMVNPLGIQLDGILTEGQSDDYTFDTLWDSEGRLTADGYVVRVAIPFRSLRFPRRQQQTWGIALARLIRRNNEEAYWPHLTKRIQGFVPQFGDIHGLRQVSPGRNVELRPYGVLAQARVLQDEAVRTDDEQRVGVDAKVVIRNAFTVDATLNPDFSQVESDDPQVTVNERFEVFFPEKRPFFVENAAFFQTPINLFFSRRIVDPGVGARLTGKVGRWAIGAIAIDDRHAGRLPAGDPRAGRSAGIGAVRLQREFGEESTIGLLFTDREFAGRSDRVFGLDARWKLNRNWVASTQIAASENRSPEDGRRSGTGAFAEIAARRETSGVPSDAIPVSRPLSTRRSALSTALAFINRTRTGHTAGGPRSPPNREPLGPTVAALLTGIAAAVCRTAGSTRASNRVTARDRNRVSHVGAFELFAGGTAFHPAPRSCRLSTNWLRWLGAEATYAWGTAVNHDPAPGLEPFLAQAQEAEVTFTLRPSPRLRLDQTYVASALDSGANRVFTEQRLRTKVTYQFTRFLSVRAILDHEVVTPNVTLTSEDHERKWAGDFLLTYLINPGTFLYLGYIDHYEDIEIDAGNRFGLRRVGRRTTSVGRQAFAKVSYSWRL